MDTPAPAGPSTGRGTKRGREEDEPTPTPNIPSSAAVGPTPSGQLSKIRTLIID